MDDETISLVPRSAKQKSTGGVEPDLSELPKTPPATTPILQQILLHVILVATQVAFSTVNIFGKIALESIEPFPLVALRCWCCVPIALLLAFFFEEESLYRSFKDWKNTFLKVGLGIGVVYFAAAILYLFGLQFSNPINTGTLYLVHIPLTAVMGMLLKYEKKMVLKVVGVVFSIAGALFLLEIDKFSISDKTIIGDLLVLGMCVLYSVYLVFSKKLGQGMGSFTVSFWMFLFSSITCILPIPFFLYFEYPITSVFYFSVEAWSSIFIVCFIGTTFTFLCTNWALQKTTSLVVAMYSPLELISTVVMALFFLNVELVWQQYVGVPLILIGLLLVLYAKYKE